MNKLDTSEFPARILIVDDEAPVVDVLRRFLGRPGITIASATDPADALTLFEEFQPDLVVLDLIMPRIGGLEILQRLRATLPPEIYLPILVVTGHPDAETRRAALAAGASDLITKPYDPIEVALRVDILLRTRMLHRQLAHEHAQLEARTTRTRHEFLSRMSDELRTPLNAILGFGELLNVPGRPPEDAENIRQILTAGRHLLGLVDGLLDIARTGGNPATVAAPSVQPPQEAQQGMLLYIEDNMSNLRLMKRMLARRPGLALLHTAQGLRGLELAREHRPNVILLDLHLPDISGDEVLDRLKRDPVTSAVPVVVVSADATAAASARLLAAGANAFLSKPLDVGLLLSAIDRFVGVPARSATSAGETQ